MALPQQHGVERKSREGGEAAQDAGSEEQPQCGRSAPPLWANQPATRPITSEPAMLMTKVCYGKCVPTSRATQMFMP